MEQKIFSDVVNDLELRQRQIAQCIESIRNLAALGIIPPLAPSVLGGGIAEVQPAIAAASQQLALPAPAADPPAATAKRRGHPPGRKPGRAKKAARGKSDSAPSVRPSRRAANRAKVTRNYPPRECEDCGEEFTPTGARSERCEDCRSAKHSPAKANGSSKRKAKEQAAFERRGERDATAISDTPIVAKLRGLAPRDALITYAQLHGGRLSIPEIVAEFTLAGIFGGNCQAVKNKARDMLDALDCFEFRVADRCYHLLAEEARRV